MADFTVRISDEKDFDRLFEIWLDNQSQAIGKQPDPSTVEALRAELSRLFFLTPRSVFYVAELASKQIIGWQALLPLLTNPLVGRYTAQSSTYIDRKFFDKNVGSQLVEFAVADAKRLGIDHIYGWVKADNIATNKIAENFETHKFFIPHPESKNLPDFNLYVIVVK